MSLQNGIFTNQKVSPSLYSVMNDWARYGFEFEQLRTGPGPAAGFMRCIRHGVGVFAEIDALAWPKTIEGARCFMTDIGFKGSFWRVVNSVWVPDGPIYHNATPEAAIAAPVGSLCCRTTGGAATTLYVKESGTGNTGWVAK